jgi:hypothetical protein
MRQTRLGHRPLVPLILHLILPFLPLTRVSLADGLFALLDLCRQGLIAVETFLTSGGQCRQRQGAVTEHA